MPACAFMLIKQRVTHRPSFPLYSFLLREVDAALSHLQEMKTNTPPPDSIKQQSGILLAFGPTLGWSCRLEKSFGNREVPRSPAVAPAGQLPPPGLRHPGTGTGTGADRAHRHTYGRRNRLVSSAGESSAPHCTGVPVAAVRNSENSARALCFALICRNNSTEVWL